MAAFLTLLLLLMLARCARADIASDRAECADQLVGLATCLPYVQGNAKTPTPDCCTGLKEVLGKSPKCLCVLVKDRDDPQLGFKINVSLALSLPSVCSVPANISDCPRLLKLPPNSAEAEIFKQPKQGNATISSVKGNSKGAQESSGGRRSYELRREGWLAVEMVGGFLLLLVLPHVVLAG